jgi:Mg-chelatase subunit ChlD
MLLMLFSVTAVAEDHIVIVLDTSGSMADYMRPARKTRMEVAQDALVEVLGDLPYTTNIGILTFDGWAYDLGIIGKSEGKIIEAIRSTRPSGGTPLYENAAKAADALLKERENNQNVGFYKLLIVTDGAAGDDRLNNDVRDDKGDITEPGVLKDIIARGITVDAIGLDMDSDHDLATKINGTYFNGNNAESLTKAVKKSVAEISFSDAKNNDSGEFLKVLEEDFSDEFAEAVLIGLSSLENQPIGEKAPEPVVFKENSSSGLQGTVVHEEGSDAQEDDPLGVLFTALGGVVIVLFMGGMLAYHLSNKR